MNAALGALLSLAWLPCLFAEPMENEHQVCVEGIHCRLASEAELDALRGGFDVDLPGGRRLRVDIGIHRAVTVNDRLVAVSRLMVNDLHRHIRSRMARLPNVDSPAQTAASAETTPPPQLLVNSIPVPAHGGPLVVDGNAIIVQNGPGNAAPLPASFQGVALPTLVQNTLDNQKLNTLTILDLKVNSASVMNAMRMSEIMNRATAASGR